VVLQTSQSINQCYICSNSFLHVCLTFMHIMAKMRRLFCPSDNMPILAVCRRPLTPYLQQQQQQQ
jgi:hypothetical protein